MRVLVTGASRELGAEVVRRLDAEPRVHAVVALDRERPRGRFGKLSFVRADLKSPRAAERIRESRPDVVVHCGVHLRAPDAVTHEINVAGTINLLAACGDAKLVVRSSAMVYPSGLEMPSVLREGMADRPGQGRLAGDLFEIETLAAEHAAADPARVVTVLRLAHTAGPRWPSPLADYLALPTPPVIGGFDPRLQVLAETDAAAAMVRAVLADHPGTYNVAPPGAVLLSSLLRAAGRRPVSLLPLGSSRLLARLARWQASAQLPGELLSLLTWGSVMDVDAFRREFRWLPQVAHLDVVRELTAARSPVVLTA